MSSFLHIIFTPLYLTCKGREVMAWSFCFAVFIATNCRFYFKFKLEIISIAKSLFSNVCLLKRFVQNYDAQVLTDKNISLVASKPMAHASPSASQEQIRYTRFTSPATAIDTTICRILSDLICANVAVHGLITESIQQAWLPPSPGRHSSLLTGLDEVGRFVLVIVIQNFLVLFKQFCRHFTYSFLKLVEHSTHSYSYVCFIYLLYSKCYKSCNGYSNFYKSCV